MPQRDRNAEAGSAPGLNKRNWLEEARRHGVEMQLCLDRAAEQADPAFAVQPLGSSVAVASRYEEGGLPRLTLVVPEWPPKLRPHEAGLWPGRLRAEVNARWDEMVGRALQAGELQQFQPRWEHASVFFSFLTPTGDPGDPDHFAHTFILNALWRRGIISDDHSSNIAMYMDASKASVGEACTVVTVAPVRLSVSEVLDAFAEHSGAGRPFA